MSECEGRVLQQEIRIILHPFLRRNLGSSFRVSTLSKQLAVLLQGNRQQVSCNLREQIDVMVRSGYLQVIRNPPPCRLLRVVATPERAHMVTLLRRGLSQKEIGVLFGLSQQRVNQILMSLINKSEEGKQTPRDISDSRMKVPKHKWTLIHSQWKAGKRVAELAEEYGVSSRRVRQICNELE